MCAGRQFLAEMKKLGTPQSFPVAHKSTGKTAEEEKKKKTADEVDASPLPGGKKKKGH